jgi:transposase
MSPRIHQKIDIPEIKAYVIDYHLERGCCRVCNRRKSSSLPSKVTPDLFVPRVKAVIGCLSGFYKNSKRELESILKDLFNVILALELYQTMKLELLKNAMKLMKILSLL